MRIIQRIKDAVLNNPNADRIYLGSDEYRDLKKHVYVQDFDISGKGEFVFGIQVFVVQEKTHFYVTGDPLRKCQNHHCTCFDLDRPQNCTHDLRYYDCKGFKS